jgi:hypothetical protein
LSDLLHVVLGRLSGFLVHVVKIISNVILHEMDGAADHKNVVGNVDPVLPLYHNIFSRVTNKSLLDEKTELSEEV